MSSHKVHALTLHLDDINDLFQQPDGCYFADHPLFEPGIEYIRNALRPLVLGIATKTTIYLPESKREPQLADKLIKAIHNYCGLQIDECKRKNSALRWEGVKALQTGLVFLGLCLALSLLFRGDDALPQFLRDFLGEGFLIAGWVSIWRPTELFLYEWWPAWRDERVYQNMLRMELTVEFE